MIASIFIIMQSLSAYSQDINTKFRINVKNTPLKTVLESMRKQSNLDFIYSDDEIKNYKITVTINDLTLKPAMAEILKDLPLAYSVKDNRIVSVIVKAPISMKQDNVEIKGRVLNEVGAPVEGATLLVVGTTKGAITDGKGNFSLFTNRGDVIEVDFVGMTTAKYVVREPELNLILRLKTDALAVEDVVVTGIYTRKAESFTGSQSTFSAKDLKAIGNTNILQSLKTLDPSFNIVESNEFGSDPNRLPDIEIRGKSSMLGMRDALSVDPNQPLFILDGFETTLATINNLDMNRVESITILKDAASTAIYGSKAANGVVVVETVKPTSGKLRVSYNGSVNVSVPDLTSYNLMNSNEKLTFERLAGAFNGSDALEEQLAEEKYNNRLKDVIRGVDTYWLAAPLRVGVNHRNSIYIEGGDGGFSFLAGGNYNGVTGVMKGSDKQIIGGNIDLMYQIGKLKFTNKFRTDYSKGSDVIVPFSEYANANQYYTKYDENGILKKWLEVIENADGTKTYIPNPMYNASLNSRNNSRMVTFSDNLNIEYKPINDLAVRARFGLTKYIDETEKFISPDDTRYVEKQILDRGDYNYTNSSKFSYEGELTVNYAKLIKDIHSISLVAGGNINSTSLLNQGYGAHGFPSGDFTYPSFSAGYKEGDMPVYYNSESRAVSAYLNGGYSLANKYLLDVSYRVNGASVFGTSKKYANTWAVGLAWNIHNEKFIKNFTDGISLMKIRGSIGNPGNQNFDSFMTFTTYKYDFNSFNYFGMSTFMNSLGNPNLRWQTTLDKNIGFDITILKKRLTINADYYYKTTDPLLISVNVPTSTGVESVMTNMGNQVSQGFTATVLGYLIYRPADNLTWNIRANLRTEKAVMGGIGNKLDALNKLGQNNKTLVRYYDGANPNDLWSVQSLGIDPATGREVYLYKDGTKSFDYSQKEEQIVGNTRPKLEGVIGTSFRYKGFTVDINFRYRFGADVFNYALYNKVENIGSLNKNQDKRAYYDRWKNPGDVAKYRDIKSHISSPISSRFVQKENTLSLESLRVGYQLPYEKLEKLGLSSVKIDAFMGDVFRASTILSERGTSYPFTRSFQLSLSLNF